MDVWDGNGPMIEAELGLIRRRPWYWPFGRTRHGMYRGYRTVVAVEPGSQAGPPRTSFRVDLGAARIGPPGFTQMFRLDPRRAAATLGRRRFTADHPDQLRLWLRHHAHTLRGMFEDGPGRRTNWNVKRSWRQLTMEKWGLLATDVQAIRSGLDELIDTVESLRFE